MELVARNRRYRCLFPVVVFCAMAARMNAQALETGTDQRVELLSIIFRLAGSPEFHTGHPRLRRGDRRAFQAIPRA